MRYALYFTPPENDALTFAAARWLGSDVFSGETSSLSGIGDLSAEERTALTADPRRYGFHATLKAPFELAAGQNVDGLLAEVEAFAAQSETFDIPEIILGQLGAFFALVPASECPPLQAFAADVVSRFEPFRAPLSQADIARRKPDAMPPVQRDHLQRWGYPYVFDEFRFHMTLTGPIPADRASPMRAVLEDVFAPFIGKPLAIGGLALFVEPARGAPFTVHSLLPLGGTSKRKIA